MMNITQSITIKIYDYYDDDDNDTPLLLDWKQKKNIWKLVKAIIALNIKTNNLYLIYECENG